MKHLQCDVVVVGAGVIGCAIARELAGHGMRVIVFDRDSPGRSATWAAAGMLSPLSDTGTAGPLLDLADRSLDLFGPLADALRVETGIDVEYRPRGKLQVSLGDTDADLERLSRAPVSARFDMHLMDGDAARELERLLTEHVTRALLIGRDYCVNNRLLAQALVASATAAGATIRGVRAVSSITMRGSRVTGVKLASGGEVSANHVVVAAGAWSSAIDGLPRAVPVRPVRGQMFAVDARGVAGKPALEHVLLTRDCYIIPRDDGRLLVGATVEDVGFQTGPTPRGLTELMQSATRLVPSLADLPVVEAWAGFRPATPDGYPVIGADPDVEGLFYATGHFRNGILLAPITAVCVSDLVTSRESQFSLEPFSIMRFPDR